MYHHSTDNSIITVVFCMIQLNLCLFYTLKNTLNYILDCRDFVESGPQNLSALLSMSSWHLDRDDEVPLFTEHAQHPGAPFLLQLGN